MMRMKNKTTELPPRNGSSTGGGAESGTGDWEIRPGGMLVQKRNAEPVGNSVPAPTIRVRVKNGSIYHEVNISSQATFGELKKMLSGPTGLHHQDQKLIYKDKERDSNAFLDMAGVKDKSKIVLMEDPISQEKRYLEMRKNAKMEKAAKSISQISLEVDRLAGQVSALETIISKGKKVAETDLINLIEQLMNQLLKLDRIMGDGDIKLQRKMQVKRVQKYVETLDMLKIKNSTPAGNGSVTAMPLQHQQKHSNGQGLNPILEQQTKQTNGPKLAPILERQSNGHGLPTIHEQQPRRIPGNMPSFEQPRPRQLQSQNSTSGVVVTTKWETFDFDSTPPLLHLSPTSTPSSTADNRGHPKFNWELFN